MHGAVYVLYVTTTLIIAVVCMAVSLTNSKRCIEVWPKMEDLDNLTPELRRWQVSLNYNIFD